MRDGRKQMAPDEREERAGLFKYLTSSNASRAWLAVLVLTLVLLCAAGFAQMTQDGARGGGAEAPAASDGLDAAGLTSNTEAETTPNKVNTSQLPDSSFIYDVTIEELASADSYLDGQTVQVTGEVVGDRITAEGEPSHCWITLQTVAKGDSELLVYMPMLSTRLIDTYGAYGKRGTTLQVRGTFQLACNDHQGSSELHAEHVAIVAKGATESMPFEPGKMIPGLLLVLAGCVLALTYNVLQERQR